MTEEIIDLHLYVEKSDDSDADSDLKPATIPIKNRPPFHWRIQNR